MKKLICILLTAALIISLSACKKDTGETAETTAASTEHTEVPETTTDETTAAETESSASQESSSASATDSVTVGQTLLADFEKQMTEDAGKGAQAIADALITNPIIPFAGASMAVEPGLLTGFGNAEITGFQEGVMFSPMIGTIPFVGYIFVLEDDADIDGFTGLLKDNADLRWNICTEAEELVVHSVGNTVFFVMCPKSFES
ncbi:hypothetical protein [Fusibacillus kribbianus]|uniref:Lipoprotein n=1 Tax=Fusibacillus kribbianus TaxID=3044208 RepID=A0AAP4BAI1_9FIRM|nr:hypothetical protein [Ruminococcus sp. YH-rum2234]MDI9243016.1 hypothetical protein [Ruminococcus sp. YH-rum2234]